MQANRNSLINCRFYNYDLDWKHSIHMRWRGALGVNKGIQEIITYIVEQHLSKVRGEYYTLECLSSFLEHFVDSNSYRSKNYSTAHYLASVFWYVPALTRLHTNLEAIWWKRCSLGCRNFNLYRKMSPNHFRTLKPPTSTHCMNVETFGIPVKIRNHWFHPGKPFASFSWAVWLY